MRVFGDTAVRRLRQIDVFVSVKIPGLSPAEVGVVRLNHGERKQKRRAVILSCLFEEIALGVKDRLVVIVEIERARADTSLPDDVHGMVPVEPLSRPIPLRMPGEVDRIDIGGQTGVKAMQLIRPNEVHLAAEATAIALRRKVVREGRYLRRELRGIVPGRDLGGQAAAHHGKTRGGTKRRVGIGGVEHDPFVGQPVKGRCLDHRVPVARQEVRRQLIGHDQHDVRLSSSPRHGVLRLCPPVSSGFSEKPVLFRHEKEFSRHTSDAKR